MAHDRLEPFRQALVDLRRRLREGELTAGARVTAKDVADRLRLSPTPVREALSRLAGEGLLEERRGEGFFVPELAAPDIAQLYQLSEHLLLIAQGDASRSGAALRSEPALQDDPRRAVEHLFLLWASEAGGRVIPGVYRTTATRLDAARRLEATLLPDARAEAAALLDLAPPDRRAERPAAIRSYFARRVALAPELARQLSPLADDGEWRI